MPAVVATFTETLSTYGFSVVSLGTGRMIAAGVVALRRVKTI
jgi:hypothetical protein